jgi:hypothetical protein
VIEGKLYFVLIVVGTYAVYCIVDAIWFWKRPDKGLLDLDVAADVTNKESISTDINYIEGRRK